MTDKNLEKALDIVSVLITDTELLKKGANAGLYEDFTAGTEVYDTVLTIFKKLNINVYEYNEGIYITAGQGNRIFGYTNEELKKELGIRLNRELYMCYYIIYTVMTRFYKTGRGSTFAEYIKPEEIISAVDSSLAHIMGELNVMGVDEIEKGSFKELALTWEDMPMVITEEGFQRAGRSSKAGFVKLVLNFTVSQGLMLEADGRYYPKDRFRAMMENYFEQYKGRIYEILKGGREDATD